jgi:predicted RNA-binding protein YlxR (DUF448 family)
MKKKAPVRSCIACRKKGAKGELVRLAATPSGVVPDYGEKLPGRGAYVCAEPSCIRDALNARALSRALKEKAEPPSYEAFIVLLRQGIERKAASLLGMARRSRRAAWGFDASMEALRKRPGGLLLVAGDISDNTLSKLEKEKTGASANAARFSTRDALGSLLGTAPVAVVYVEDRGIAAALELEIGRLNVINRG